MDLTGALLRAGAARPHVLVAAVPGATEVRLAAEGQLRRSGWPAAMTPADADILLVCGDPGEPLMAAVEEAWRAMPAPRARASAIRPGEVAPALEEARGRLADRAAQHALAAGTAMDASAGMADMDMGGAGMAMDTGMSGTDPGMGMGGMIVRGTPMARRADDRDGLRLDQLHVPLGPVLADWPAGLVLRVALQGDVIQQAEAEILGGAGPRGGSFWDEPWRRAAAGDDVTVAEAAQRSAAARLDSLGRLLALAGWDTAAATARRLRDELLASAAGTPPARLAADARRLARRVARSRMLAWLTRGLGPLAGQNAATGHPVGDDTAARGAAGEDVTARYRRWCADLEDAVASLGDTSPLRPSGADHASAGVLGALPRLVAGTELGAARLIVASLDPELESASARGAEDR